MSGDSDLRSPSVNLSKSQERVLSALADGGELAMGRMLGSISKEHDLDGRSDYGWPHRHVALLWSECARDRYAVGLDTIEALLRRGLIENGPDGGYVLSEAGREALEDYRTGRVAHRLRRGK